MGCIFLIFFSFFFRFRKKKKANGARFKGEVEQTKSPKEGSVFMKYSSELNHSLHFTTFSAFVKLPRPWLFRHVHNVNPVLPRWDGMEARRLLWGRNRRIRGG